MKPYLLSGLIFFMLAIFGYLKLSQMQSDAKFAGIRDKIQQQQIKACQEQVLFYSSMMKKQREQIEQQQAEIKRLKK
ncbi:hypothetical protein [Spirosoma agri]|uniref:Uncharacterized protein n=1 Tax=Spirosoma agri TaxID=1987381 RepID=A0A6M0IQ14_9BACT|nr:hypothetical protein [Spirosoma agri]NEU70409.1 hypothetical protein [Spirosoma agri]